jgi:ABC-2 type transport system permease protein
MLNDIETVVWKEWRELIARSTQSRSDTLKTIAVCAVILGIVIWRSSFLVQNLGVLFVPSFILLQLLGGLMVDSFAGERERHTLETLLATRLSDLSILIGKITAGVVLAWGLMACTIALGVATAYVGNEWKQAHVSVVDLATILGFYLLFCLIMACAGALVSLRAPTVRQAVQTLTWSFMAVFFLAIFGWAKLPPEWRSTLMRSLAGQNLQRTEIVGASVLLFVIATLFAAARIRFQRARLILD